MDTRRGERVDIFDRYRIAVDETRTRGDKEACLLERGRVGLLVEREEAG